MGIPITLRNINKNDLEWARRLRNKNRKYFFDDRSISQAQQKKWFQTLSYSFFVIEYNGKPAGTIAIRSSHGQHEVHNVLIDEKYRKKGILKQAIAVIVHMYGTPLYVDVQIRNKNAVRAYAKLGFYPLAYRMLRK